MEETKDYSEKDWIDNHCPRCDSIRLEYTGQSFYGDDDDPVSGYRSYRCRDCGYTFDTSQEHD